MRNLAIGLALASTSLATPSMARDGQWYVGVDGGAMIVEDMDVEVGPAPIEGVLDTDVGYDFGAVVGYDFGQCGHLYGKHENAALLRMELD